MKCNNADRETESREEMIKQKSLGYQWSLKDQPSARGTRRPKESWQEGSRAGFLTLSNSSRGSVLRFRGKRETVEQAECLKYMTGVI